jgi:hypothetical protein
MAEIRAALQSKGYDPSILDGNNKPPLSVKIAPRLHEDIQALDVLFSPEQPPLRQVRPSKTSVASYMFGDASGCGFGSSMWIDSDLHYVHGQWDINNAQESSNYRELSNLINAIEKASFKGLLEDTELFVFTDNFVAESTFHKGTSSSKRLFD